MKQGTLDLVTHKGIVGHALAFPFSCWRDYSIDLGQLRSGINRALIEKSQPIWLALGADGGGRTHTVSLPTDFKSVASAYSATSACV